MGRPGCGGVLMGTNRIVLITAIVSLASLVLCACGGSGSGTAVPDPPGALESGQWLSFPPATGGGTSPYRLVSDDTRVVQGDAYTEAHGADNYQLPATEDYVLVSGLDDRYSWAVYNVDALSAERPVALEVAIDAAAAEPGGGEPLPLSCWIGVSDFSTYGWEWHGPFTETDSLTLNSELIRDRYVSADCVMTFAVLTFTSSRFASGGNPQGRTAVLIDLAEIETRTAAGAGYYATRPHFAEITEVSFGEEGKGASELEPFQYVNLHWEHVDDPDAEDCEADEYFVYRRGPGSEPRRLIGSVTAPATGYCDPLDNDPGVDEAQPGMTYTYYLQAANDAGSSGPDRVPVTIPDEMPVQDTIVVVDYTVRVENASNGVGFDPELFSQAQNDGTIGANTVTNLSLAWIEGTFNGLPFSGAEPGAWPDGMTQADYDAALEAVHDRMQWYVTHGGAEEFRRTADWLTLDDYGSPPSGDPGAGIVFADDDPTSVGAEGEGGLLIYLPGEFEVSYPETEQLSVRVFGPITFVIGMDVEADPAAPELLAYEDAGGEPYEYFQMEDDEIEVHMPFAWGVGGQPADPGALELELHGFAQRGGESAGAAVTFAYTAGTPDVGEFTVDTFGDDPVAICLFDGWSLSERYSAFRLRADETWSSINKPDQLVQTVYPPQHTELVTIPEHCWPEIDQLQIYYHDPVVRMDFSGGDALKVNGMEFAVEAVGPEQFPRIIVQETGNPYDIDFDDESEPGVMVAQRCPGRLVVDIAALTIGGGPGDPVRQYAYRCFNSDGFVIGHGYFDVSPIGGFAPQPVGVDWGVNVWDREEREIGDRDFSYKVLDGSTIGGVEPDVLWFELSGGWLHDWEQDDSQVYAGNPYPETANVTVRIEDQSTEDWMFLECSLRIAGIGPSATWIVVHKPDVMAFRFPGVPGWPGIFEPDHTYDVQLDDPRFFGAEYTYSGALTVTGTNPNI